MIIRISGQTPAQKNSKQLFKNHRTGATFITSSKVFKSWQVDALAELERLKIRIRGRVQIDYFFYVKDNRGRDLDNMIASVNDALVTACKSIDPRTGKPEKGTGILEDDSWQFVRIGSADAKIDKENPHAKITITELD